MITICRHNYFACLSMKTITFKDEDPRKIEALVKLANDLGVQQVHNYGTDKDEFELGAPPVGEAEADAWLTKENGEKVSAEEAERVVNKHIGKIKEH